MTTGACRRCGRTRPLFRKRGLCKSCHCYLCQRGRLDDYPPLLPPLGRRLHRPDKRAPLGDVLRCELVRLYQRGYSTWQIARAFDTSANAVADARRWFDTRKGKPPMRLTSAQRARLRELCDQQSTLTMSTVNLGALLDQLDEAEAAAREARSELALLRPIAIAADKLSDSVAEFGLDEPAAIGERVDQLDIALAPWLEAQQPAPAQAE